MMRRGQLMEDMEQDDRIQSAGDGHQDGLTIPKKISLDDGLFDLTNPRMHGEILGREWR